MSEQALEEVVKKLILSNVNDVKMVDVFEDILTSYQVLNGILTPVKNDTLSNYLESCKNVLQPDYLSNYVGMFSIPKLESALKAGKDKLELNYKNFNGKWFKLTTTLVSLNGKKIICAVSENVSLNEEQDVKNNDSYSGLMSNLSDAMLKIHNVFGIDSSKIKDLKSVEEYVNSVLLSLTSKYPELKEKLLKSAKSISGMAYDTLLIVDDDLLTRNMIKKIFDGEYKIAMASNGKEAIEYLKANENKGAHESADNVLGIFLDLTMPVMDGFAVLEYLSKNNYLSRIPVIIISGDYEKETKARVYNYNIADMLEKPFDFQVVKHRISNFINLYKSSNSLTNLISDQNSELKDLVIPFVYAYEYDYEENIKRIKEYVSILATQVMEDYPEYNLTAEKIEKIKEASKYYDIGFYSIPRKILNKKTALNEDELKKIKEYPLFGSKMIKYVLSLMSDMEFKDYALNIVKYYHENYDGTGYPSGIKAEKIPLEAQITAVCIMYNNVFKKAGTNPRDVIISKSNKMFNPKIVESFKKVSEDFPKVSS